MQLATRIFGEQGGKDIVLLHGTGARAEMWHRQIEPLVELGYRCIVPDLRGHGQSHEPGELTDIEAHMLDVRDTLAACNTRLPSIFVGHSLGAIISLELAQRQPELFSKVLAVSMPGRVPAVTTEAFRWLLAMPYENLRGTAIHRRLDWRPRVLLETNRHALEQIMHNFSDLDYCTNVPRVDCPVHFAVGRLDPVAPFHSVMRLHKAMPNSTLEIIEWAGHNCMDSQPEKFNRWFMDKIRD